MKISLKIGDKVEIPLTKSQGCEWERSLCIQRAKKNNQNYLYIVDIKRGECELDWTNQTTLGEKFLLQEVKLWSEDSISWDIIEEIKHINEEFEEENKKDLTLYETFNREKNKSRTTLLSQQRNRA